MKENKELDNIINNAKELGSYFITVTTLDKTKDINNLTHSISREDFPIEDIVPSLDNCVRLLGIRQSEMADVIVPKRIEEERKKLRIAIITHFNRCPSSYSPATGTKHLIKMLKFFGHSVVLFTQEGHKLEEVDFGCEIKGIVPKYKREKNVLNEDIKNKFIENLKLEIDGKFDVCITIDLYLDDCLTYREALKEANININFLNWARSGVGRPINFAMKRAKYIYMNYADAKTFADAINVDISKIRIVFNSKDPSIIYKWNDTSKMINNKMRLWEKDIIQIAPFCSSRLDAKGMNSIIRVFSELKKCGKKVCLIVANSNARHRVDEINSKIKFAEELGLKNGIDFIFTSTLANENFPIDSELPNESVLQLMQVSNLFVFPTVAEVSSNVELESSISKCLLVLNEDLPCLFDFVDRNAVLSYPFTSSRNLHYSGREDKNINELAKKIIYELDNNKADRQMRHVWRNNCFEAVYKNQLEPILYEDIIN